MNWKNIQIIEFIVFFFGWIIILLAGADFPPPKGFSHLVILIFVLDVLQAFYLHYLIPRFNGLKMFVVNECLFLIAGILTPMLFILINGYALTLTCIWLVLIAIVSLVYGTCFYGINDFISKHLKEER